MERSNKRYKHQNIKKVILVSSAKGGVGKSTISAVLAQQLYQDGFSVGILDADIMGFSIASIFGINISELDSNNILDLHPKLSHGVYVLSVGNSIHQQQYFALRGLLLIKILNNFFLNANWPKLDYLIVDTPPGTGDVHISIINNYHVDGSLIVSKQDKLSINNTIKSINLFKAYRINLLGLINNMCIEEYNKDFFCDNIFKYFEKNQIISVPFNLDVIKKIDKGEKIGCLFEDLTYLIK